MTDMTRANGRLPNEMRAISLETGVSRYAEGSCLVRFGHTQVLCTASVDNFVPPFLRNTGKGWVTAEYGMLPRATHSRNPREAAKGKQGGRTMEIQRLIGRSLRAVVNLEALGERQIVVDCDVIEADGGTRTASITGGYVALAQAINTLVAKGQIKRNPLLDHVAAISCGISKGLPVLDLDYEEDSAAEVDSNFVMTGAGLLVEVQGTAEHNPFSPAQLHSMLELAQHGIGQLVTLQKQALAALGSVAA